MTTVITTSNNIQKQHIYERKSHETKTADKLIPRLLGCSAKMYAFLDPAPQKPSSRQLSTLGQKQYLAGEAQENCLI